MCLHRLIPRQRLQASCHFFDVCETATVHRWFCVTNTKLIVYPQLKVTSSVMGLNNRRSEWAVNEPMTTRDASLLCSKFKRKEVSTERERLHEHETEASIYTAFFTFSKPFTTVFTSTTLQQHGQMSVAPLQRRQRSCISTMLK